MVRLFVPIGSGRQRFNVLGALDVVSMTLLTIQNTTTITQKEVIELLKKARATTELPLTLVLDNARYQRAKLVQEAAQQLGIELLFLPPYSPNLNLIERLWKWTKKECLRARVMDSFEEFRGAIEGCLTTRFREQTPKLRSLLTLNFQSFGKEYVLLA